MIFRPKVDCKPKSLALFIFTWILCFLCFATSAYGSDYSQSSLTDLEKGLTNISDPSEKINQLLYLSEQYQDNAADKALDFANQALALAQKNKLALKEIDSYNALGMAYLALKDLTQSKLQFDKALSLNTHQYTKGFSFTYLGKAILGIESQSYQEAIVNLKEAEASFSQDNNQQGLAYVYANYGSVYQIYENFEASLSYHLKALKINESLANKEEIATNQNNIALIYAAMGDFESALDYAFKSMKLNEEIANQEGMGASLNTAANLILNHFENYDLALDLYLKAVAVNEAIDNKAEIANAMNNIGSTLIKLERYEEALNYFNQALNLRYQLDDMEGIINSYNNIGVAYYYMGNLEDALAYHIDALELAKDNSYNEGLRSALYNLSNDYAKNDDYKSAFDFYRLYATIKDQIFSKDYSDSISKMKTVYETEKKEQENALLKTSNELLEKDKFIQRIVIALSLTILIIVSALGLVIAKEKKKSEKLLLNILPVRVAQDLKETGKTTPEVFESVTVYFSDIVGFTSTSSHLEPKFLINELSEIFTEFDRIMAAHGCERIKTIGDAYMGVANMTIPNENHAESMLLAASEILAFLHQRNASGDIQWRIRIGLHSGKLVGGVVGTAKYIYDVFGDTVNTASRMESNSEPMRINVSHTTYDLLKDRFSFFEREPIEVKGKGLFHMYFYEGPLPDASPSEPLA